MNKKHIVATVILTAIAVFIITTAFYAHTSAGRMIYSEVSESSIGKSYAKFMEIETLIDENYMGEADKDQMIENAFTAYVATLGDPYTGYLNAESFDSMQESLSGGYSGIGVEINVTDDKINVVSVKSGSPAEAAGIVSGDYIISINSVSYTGSQINEAIAAIKSDESGSELIIGIEREGEFRELTVKRESIDMEYITSEMLSGNIGYIRIKTFGKEIYEDFKTALNTLTNSGMQSLIIDLRSNPGGVLDVVVDITDLLVPEGIITTVREKSGKVDEYKSDAQELGIPMCVLINEESASASEVMAGALRDFDKAAIIGKTSFGKGVVQGIYEFGDNTAMRITVAKYYTPSGECIHGTGIKPDIEVDLPEDFVISNFSDKMPGDTQLEKAIEFLQGK